MKMIFRTALVLLAVATTLPASAQSVSAADQAALLAVAARSDAVWNAKDTDGMAAIYAEDGMLRLASEAPLVGRAAMRDYFAAAFARRPDGFRHVTRLTVFQALSPDLVLTDSDVSVEQRQADGTWKVARRFRTNSVAMRQGRNWVLSAVRAIPLADTVPAPAKQP